MTIAPQSQDLYRVLLTSDQPMEAKQLAKKLNVFPATVYRLTEPLIKMGLITQTNEYPSQFIAKSVDEGLHLFLLNQNDWFSHQFFNPDKKKVSARKRQIPKSQQVSISFIQGRDELMNLSEKEINRATESVDLLRSGHEIPADVMLALVEAKRRNVQTRMLIQDYSLENASQVTLWKRNGILVRKTELRYIRLMLYDSQTLYFMSYKHTDSRTDLGMKIDYPPLTVILSQLFDQWWEKSETV